jgi:uncharacterized membrane protein YdbT with pleckstrin-like domain
MSFVLPVMRRPRHPVARALSVLLGMAAIGVLLVFGLVVASVLLVGGVLLLAWRQWKRAGLPRSTAAGSTHRPEILEGEFVVLQQHHRSAH